MWTRPLDVAVREEPLGLWVVHLLGGALVDVAVFEQPQEHVLGDGVMVGGPGRREQVP